jgi:hypothetical protein
VAHEGLHLQAQKVAPEIYERFWVQDVETYREYTWEQGVHTDGDLPATGGLVVLAFVIGASFIGADWRAGTVVTQLTWEPRRIRILAAKAVAVVLAMVLATVIFQALLAGALVPGALRGGGFAGADASWLRATAGEVLRGAALSGIAAAIGIALGSIGRNTALALGAGFIYLAVLEGGLLTALFHGIDRWLVVPNAIEFVVGGGYLTGRSVTAAGLLLTGYAVVTATIAATLFRARDVT